MIHFTYSSSSDLFFFFCSTNIQQLLFFSLYTILYALQSDIHISFYFFVSFLLCNSKRKILDKEEEKNFFFCGVLFLFLCDFLYALFVRLFFICVYSIGRALFNKRKSNVRNYKKVKKIKFDGTFKEKKKRWCCLHRNERVFIYIYIFEEES